MSKKIKLTLAALLSVSLLLASCDRVKDVVGSSPSSQESKYNSAQNTTSQVADGEEINLEQQYSPVDYINLESDLQIPTVYSTNYLKAFPNYNVLSTSYKNYLYKLANLEEQAKATQQLNELYISLSDVLNAPNAEVVIFYIDSLRNLQLHIQEGLNTLAWTNGIDKDQSIKNLTDDQRVQFLTNITTGINQLTDNFFVVHQFLGQRDFGLDAKQATDEYERYQNVVRLLKNQNSSLIQYDVTCTTNYDLSGDVINCLQQKLNVAFAALDTQLLHTFNVYLTKDKNDSPEYVKENLIQLKKNLYTVINKNKQSFDYYNSLLAK